MFVAGQEHAMETGKALARRNAEVMLLTDVSSAGAAMSSRSRRTGSWSSTRASQTPWSTRRRCRSPCEGRSARSSGRLGVSRGGVRARSSRRTSGPNQVDHLLPELRRVRRSRLRHRGYSFSPQEDRCPRNRGQLQAPRHRPPRLRFPLARCAHLDAVPLLWRHRTGATPTHRCLRRLVSLVVGHVIICG